MSMVSDRDCRLRSVFAKRDIAKQENVLLVSLLPITSAAREETMYSFTYNLTK
jgi:hypothetical protein